MNKPIPPQNHVHDKINCRAIIKILTKKGEIIDEIHKSGVGALDDNVP